MSGYIGTQPVPQATQTRDSFTCTAGQTSFATGGYTPNFLDVYLNGVKLTATDYTASNGSDVVLASGAAAGDVLEVVAFTTFDVVTDTITAAGTALTLDRTGSDGTILDLKKDGSTVGSIGSNSTKLTIGGTATYDPRLRFGQTNNLATVQPADNTGGLADDTVNFGQPNYRFKDLYLSGGVYLGGTGSANHLDDYEEGTWTPTVTYGTINSSGGTYTKIGRVVHCAVVFSDASDTSNGNAFEISGLPFDADPDGSAWGSSMWNYNSTGKHICYISSSNRVYFYHGSTGGGYSILTHSELTSGAGAHVFFTYTTSQ